MEMKIGSLFTGIGGLELGVCDTVMSIAPYGNDIEWIAETDKNARKILEHSTMFHGVPNLGNACTPQQASEAFYHGLLQMTRERASR